MNNKVLMLLFACVVYIHAEAQNPYSLLLVPDSVKKNASVIKRFENIVFEVTDIDRASLDVHQVYTVLSEAGRQALMFMQYSTKFMTLEDVEIKVLDAYGDQLNKYRKKDLALHAISDDVVDDGKVHYFEVPAASFPVTVEYKYKSIFKGTLVYPAYTIITPGQGVESSQFTAKVPKDLGLRYKEKNIRLSPQITEEGKYIMYRWSTKNLSPIHYEEGAVSYESRYPSILLAPNRFKLENYEGDMTSWKSFGQWYVSLLKGTNVLSAEKQETLKDLVKDAGSEREKIKLIYQYLQQNFRYVSIQLGIGGFKPFSADFTDKRKYGDCKALSNYMQAGLNAIGVKSYVALVNAAPNKEAVDPNFPCNQFNHVILCVPQPRDTIWLECTSKTNDFGVLGSFTENRNALLITENGGILVATPVSKASDNQFNAYTRVYLEEDGTGKTSTHLRTAGEYKQDLINHLLEESQDDQKKFVVEQLGFKQPEKLEINKETEADKLLATINLRLDRVPDFTAGNKMFLNQRLYRLLSGKLPAKENRRQDYFFDCPFEKTDTTVIHLPSGYTVDALPKSKTLKCEYASYSTQYWFDEKQQTIFSTARISLNQHRIPASKYGEVKHFFDEVLLDNSQKIVIRK